MKKAIFLILILSLCMSATGCIFSKLPDFGGASIEETTLFEYDGLTVTATDIKENKLLGTANLSVKIENKSEKNYTVYCDTVYVNGCVAVNYLDAEVFAGKSSTEELMLLDSVTKEMYGVDKTGLIECYFFLYEGEELVETFLAPLKTDDYDSEQVSVKAEGAALYDKDGIRIFCKEVFAGDDSLYSDTAVVLCLQNNTDKNLYFDVESVSAGEEMVEGYLYSSVFAGTTICDFVEVIGKDIEEDSEISFSLIIYDLDTGEKIASTGVMTTSGKAES